MKAWRIFSGILSIVFYSIVDKQSRLARVAEVLTNDEESTAGSGGQVVALLLLVGGILSIVLFKAKKTGSLILALLFGIAAAIGFSNAGFYQDLYIWSGWCAICAALALPGFFSKKKQNVTVVKEEKKETGENGQ